MSRLWKTLMIAALLVQPCARAEEEAPPKVNKLLYMYHFFYLPFSVDFREGKTSNDILPIINDGQGEANRLLRVDELQAIDKEWNTLKDAWRKKSLLLN